MFTVCNEITNILPKLTMESEPALLNFVLLFIVYMRAVLYFTRCSLIAADIIVLVLTWIKSFEHFKEMRQLNLGLSVSAVLLRDGKLISLSTHEQHNSCSIIPSLGTIYFLILLAVNILQLLTFSESSLSGPGSTYASIFTEFMMTIP
ncbi:uncharacterized protein PHACADRAFT_196390 [Phanerochaete carnosa HHB-10118-sp]|uniref:Uncharacterized protein n=1 Tax=Phanerochaete carnosa (strain HHB-10118-sp) TaxID=650164 RepID=K5W485_PHACS|nr:uncharacterized protein PHACADRAFT_196390 [Phanerochaete carnosa HHB-10118-sp]EKM53955.1 hypothetical protein PHACADRAFT_196390 [Phanerochaete carnosa HHB-10118-sp]